jgi:hypothetical protein
MNTATNTTTRAQEAIESAPANGQPRTLVEIVDHEALGYRAWKTPEGDFLAAHLEHLAQLLRWTGASTPSEHFERLEVWEAEVAERHFDRGYAEGLEAGLREHCHQHVP